jgi:hypothetical protein
MKPARLVWVGLVAIAVVAAMPRHSRAVSAGDVRRALIRLMAPGTRPVSSTQPAGLRFEAVDLPLKTEGATGETAEWLKSYDVRSQRFAYTLDLVSDEDTIRVYRLVYPSPFESPWPENNKVPAELYLPKKVEGRLPAAIVLDILDGSAVLARGLARGMAEQGVAALYMPQACYGERRPADNAHFRLFMRDPNAAITNVRQTVMDVRRG